MEWRAVCAIHMESALRVCNTLIELLTEGVWIWNGLSHYTLLLIDGSKSSCWPCCTIQGHMMVNVRTNVGILSTAGFSCNTASKYDAEVGKLKRSIPLPVMWKKGRALLPLCKGSEKLKERTFSSDVKRGICSLIFSSLM